MEATCWLSSLRGRALIVVVRVCMCMCVGYVGLSGQTLFRCLVEVGMLDCMKLCVHRKSEFGLLLLAGQLDTSFLFAL